MLHPDHDQKQAKHKAENDGNVIEFKPRKDVAIKLSKVYARGVVKDDGTNEWAFNVSVGGDTKGYAFSTRTDAIKGRVLFQKKLKSEGYQIHCQS